MHCPDVLELAALALAAALTLHMLACGLINSHGARPQATPLCTARSWHAQSVAV